MELNVFKLQKQPLGFDEVEYSILNWVGDFSLEGVEFDHEEEVISCVYKSCCIEYEPEYDTCI